MIRLPNISLIIFQHRISKNVVVDQRVHKTVYNDILISYVTLSYLQNFTRKNNNEQEKNEEPRIT